MPESNNKVRTRKTLNMMHLLQSLTYITYNFQLCLLLACLLPVFVAYYFFWVVEKPTLICKDGFLRRMLNKKCPTLSSYYYPTFWCFEGKAQTLFRVLLKSRPQLPYRREILSTPDGGVIHLDWVDSCVHKKRKTEKIVIILPGLTGGSECSYAKHIAVLGQDQSIRTVIFNNRGFGPSKLKTPRTFSAVDTEDLKLVLNYIHDVYAGCSIVACGFSLGGMITTQYLIESGDECLLDAAMSISVPWNSYESTLSLEQPLNALLFNRHLANKLCEMIKRNIDVFKGHIGNLPYDLTHVLKSKSIREFDERFTSPTFGYRNNDEYYHAASLHAKNLDRIRKPTVFLNAADDPFSPMHGIPIERIKRNDLLALVLTARGGHIGFVEGLLVNDVSFMEKLFMEYAVAIFNNHFDMPDDCSQKTKCT